MARARWSGDNPIPIGEALRTVAGRVTQTDLLGIAEISSVWTAVVGERLATEAQPMTLRDGRLLVSVPSSVWAGQVRLMTREILEKLGQMAATPVEQIEVVVRRT